VRQYFSQFVAKKILKNLRQPQKSGRKFTDKCNQRYETIL